MATTLHDLARACACNVSTVSRALRGDPRISREVRTRIMEEAARQGYRPNLTARSLVSGRSGTIWFLAGSLASPIDHQPAEAASRLCQDQGMDLLVAVHHWDPVTHQRLLERLRQGVADGAIIAASQLDHASPVLRDLAESGFPLVFIDRHVAGIRAPVATTDHRAGSRQVVAALKAEGVKTVVNLHPHGLNTVEDARRRYLAQAIIEAGLSPWSPESAHQAPVAVVASQWHDFERWRGQAGPLSPGAVLCFYDHLTGDPPVGCRIMVVEQDFAGMATAAWSLLHHRLAGGAASNRRRLIPLRGVRSMGAPVPR